MHKYFYASGFIYHPPTEQILLQQLINDNEAKLVLFQVKSRKGHNPQTVFKRSLEKALGINISASSIHPVYDYVNNKLGAQFIFYVEVADITPPTYSAKNKADWFLLSKLSKFNMSEQTRHDITVGGRVIRSLMETEYDLSQQKPH